MELELILKSNYPSGGFFYISAVLINQNMLEVGKKYKLIITEIKDNEVE